MKLSDLAIELPHVIRNGDAAEIISPPGRGKSTFAHWLVEELSRQDDQRWGKAELFLGTASPPDLIGYLFKGEVTYNGKTYSITDPTLPTWFICDDGLPCFAYQKGILILDEFGKGQPDTKAASGELFLHGRIGPHYLPDGWGRLALSNRQSDRSGETKSLDFVINRRVEYHLADDLPGTVAWFEAHDAPYQIVAFMQNEYDQKTGQPICFEAPPEKQGPWCTPRSLYRCGMYLQGKMQRTGADTLPYDPITIETVQGYIGVPAAQALFAHLMIDREQPPFAEIVKHPDSVRVPERADAMMLVCYSLANKVDRDTLKPVLTYVNRLSKDFSITFARAMLRKTPQLASHQVFLDWSQKNGTLIAQIAAINSAVKF